MRVFDKNVKRTRIRHPVVRDSRWIQYLRTFLSDELEKTKKIEQGRDTLARRRIPIVGLVYRVSYFSPSPLPPGTQWIVERLIIYCMIIDILSEILLIDIYIYINFIATVEHSNIWGYIRLGRYLGYLLGTSREYYIERKKKRGEKDDKERIKE